MRCARTSRGRRRSRRRSASCWQPGRPGADDGASLGSGIGGSRNPEALKCLHAHVAFALARPGYLLGEAILDEIPARWPPSVLHARRPGLVASSPMPTVESARREWEEGSRRFQEAARRPRTRRPAAPAARRRHGGAAAPRRRRPSRSRSSRDAYDGAERWLLGAVEERAPARGWARTATLAADAAFHAYSRGALDYEP